MKKVRSVHIEQVSMNELTRRALYDIADVVFLMTFKMWKLL